MLPGCLRESRTVEFAAPSCGIEIEGGEETQLRARGASLEPSAAKTSVAGRSEATGMRSTRTCRTCKLFRGISIVPALAPDVRVAG